MSQKIRVVALFAAAGLAACSDSPIEASRTLNPAFGPKAVVSATLPPLTLAEPEVFEPLLISNAFDNGGILSRDNAPANMGDDRPEHIKYWGGRLILQQAVTSIYYGPAPIYKDGPTPGTTGAASDDNSLVGFYLRNTGSSSRWAVNTAYSETVNKVESFVQPSMKYNGFWATSNGPAAGATVSFGQMVGLVEAGFANSKFTYDPKTLYVIFTGPGVNLGGGFSKTSLQYCAFHSAYVRANGDVVQISAMPYDADFTPTTRADNGGFCVPQNGSPNADFGADGIVSALQHETEETTTDPYINGFRGWYDIHGFESSDKCAYIYGQVFRNTTGFFNIAVGGKPFLVQGQWRRSASTPERCATTL
jgi:hypothetical protein